VQRLNNQTLRSLSNAADPPRYDRHATRVGIAHIGVGAFHRSHQAMFLDRLRRLGRHEDWGIAGIGLFPAEASTLDRFTAQDGLYTLLLRRSGKPTIARIIGSLTEYVLAPEKPDRAMNRLTDKATKIVSLTITEGGYALDPETGAFDTEVPAIARDLDTGDRTSVFGLITAALDERRIAKTGPFTVMSCDNIQGNGHVARRAFTAFARCRSADLANWITENVAFPNSMVDRITPVPTEADSAEVAASYGYVDQWALAAEPFLQWVLEDDFCAGRPDFEQAGVQLVDDVTPYEKLKLRLLNASHQVISHFGRLLGYTYVHEAASDPMLRRYLRAFLLQEAVPTLDTVPGVDIRQYCDDVVERFGNAAVADTLARICASSSDRFAKFVVPVVRDRLLDGGQVRLAAATVASWARSADGTDETGRRLELEDDRLLTVLSAAADSRAQPSGFLRQPFVFGDLAEHPGLMEPFEWALRSLRERGTRRTLTELLTRT
jgi:mannitol 2-dehydrogenase